MTSTMTNPITPVLTQQQEAMRCPYPHYAELRESAPVFYDEQHNVYVVTRHADIQKVNNQPRLFSSQCPMGPTVADAVAAVQRALTGATPEFIDRVRVVVGRGDVLFTQDPPGHSRHRRILNKALTPRAVAQIEPDIRAMCHALVDKFVDAGQVDLIPEFCSPAPIHALSKLLGVPVERTPDFERWTAALNAPIGTSMSDEELIATLTEQIEFWTFVESEVSRRLEHPTDDLISAVAHARSDGDQPLTINEMVGFSSQLITAGADTTTKQISSFMLMLCRDPGLMAEVRSNIDDLPRYLEEGLRLESPVQGLFRVATEDTELGGVPIPAGAMVWVVYGSGNRDNSVFDRPDEFDADRDKLRTHLAFGHGPHTCIGAPLARAVSRIAFEVLFERLDDIQLRDDRFVPEFYPSYIMHGMKSLPVTFTART
jgi:cytochrome P450